MFVYDTFDVSAGLPFGEVHVWLVELPPEEALEAQLHSLSPNERSALSAIRPALRRRQRITSWHIRRTLLAEYLGVSPDTLTFPADLLGKPQVCRTGVPLRDFHFSTAYCANRVLLAICRSPVGVDLEEMHEFDLESFVATHFAAEEREYWRRLASLEARTETLFQCWTLKEAFLKATGLGLTQPPSSIAFGRLSTADPVLLQADGDRAAGSGWHFRTWRSAGWVAALAFPRAVCSVRTARYLLS